MRDMIRMLAATYALSVTSTPIRLCGESTGPMIVRNHVHRPPGHHAVKQRPNLLPGLVRSDPSCSWGPRPVCRRDAIKVTFSVRATSLGLLRSDSNSGKWPGSEPLFGPRESFPRRTLAAGASEPSHHTTRFGPRSCARLETPIALTEKTLSLLKKLTPGRRRTWKQIFQARGAGRTLRIFTNPQLSLWQRRHGLQAPRPPKVPAALF